MPKTFVRKTFDRWLAHSAARLHHSPRVVLQRKQYIELQFLGITPAIRCAISKEGMVGIYASYQGEWWEGWDAVTSTFRGLVMTLALKGPQHGSIGRCWQSSVWGGGARAFTDA